MNATDYQVQLLQQRVSELEQKVQEFEEREDVPQYTAAEGEDTRRAWEGLTDDEANEIAGSFDYRYDVARAIEAKLKEKNTNA